MKKLLTIIALIVLMSGCSQKNSKQDVYVLLKTLNGPFFAQIEKGIRDNVDYSKYNVVIRAGKDESDLGYQISTLSTLTDWKELKNICGVIITPCGSNNELIPYLKILKDNNIPIIIVDTKIDINHLKSAGLENTPYVGSLNYRGGKQAAEFLFNYSKTKASIKNILILNGVNGQESAIQRNRGFIETVDSIKKMQNIDIRISERTANWQRREAQNILEAFMMNNMYFDAIFAANDEMALGAIRALTDKKIKFPIVIGFDAIEEAKNNISDGKGLTATIEQDPYSMGSVAIKQIQDYYKNIPTHSQIIETKVVTNK